MAEPLAALDGPAVLALLPQQEPFRFVDEILEVDDDHIVSRYTFRPEADFYRGHFPGNPITPGVLLIEAMAQTGVVALGIYIVARERGVEDVRRVLTVFTDVTAEFSGVVRPGDTVTIRGAQGLLPPHEAARRGRDAPRRRVARRHGDPGGHGSRGRAAGRGRGTGRKGMTRRRVVVTGMGVVAPNGVGLEDFDAALRAGRSGIRHVPKLAELGFACTVAGVPQGTDPIAESYFDSDLLLAMNSNHRYGSIAAIDAWTDAGFARPDRDDDHVYWEAGAVLGTGIGGLDTVGGKLVPMTDAGKVRRLGSTIVEQVMSSGISARVSGLLALGNQVTTNSSACSTGTEAIIDGANRIRMGLAERMLCGGSEGDSHYIWAGFDGMRVLSRQWNDEPEKASRPMSASAGGFVPAAGAGVLHLESLESATRRGARIYAELLGGALNCGGPPRRRQHDRPEPGERAPLRRGRAGRRLRLSARDRRDQRPPHRHDRRPERGPCLGRGARARPGRAAADHLDEVDDRPRARRRGRDRVGRLHPDAPGRLRPPLAQLRGRAPPDRAVP